MRLKWLVVTILCNIFALLFVSIMVEYNSLSGRLQNMENNIATALDTAVDTAMMSEEFFSEGFTDRYYSYAVTENATAARSVGSLSADKAPSMSYSKIFLYRGGKWIAGNTYVMAYAYQQLGRFPETQNEIDQFTLKFTQGHGSTNAENASRATIYSWLYGSVGQWYTSPALQKWSSTNDSTIRDYQALDLGFGDKNVTGQKADRQKTQTLNDSGTTVYTPSDVHDDLVRDSNNYTPSNVLWDATEGISGLTPTADFAEFYNTVGQQVLSRSPAKIYHKIIHDPVKRADGTEYSADPIDTFKVKTVVYPTLWNMGLTFNGAKWTKEKISNMSDDKVKKAYFQGHTYTVGKPGSPDGSAGTEANEVPTNTSKIMTDNWCATYHIGKQKTKDDGTVDKYNSALDVNESRSIYMLTPMSLGVTYVPLKVAKPLFAANLENVIRLGRMKSRSNQGLTGGVSNTALEGANNCIDTSIWTADDTGTWSSTKDANRTHTNHETEGHYLRRADGSESDYITDGMIEYDMSSIKMKVDYFYVDFGDPANAEIVNRCIGATPIGSGIGFATTLDAAAKKIADDSVPVDTATHYYNQLGTTLIGAGSMSPDEWRQAHMGTTAEGVTKIEKNSRIVAKVKIRMRVQVPYQAPVMQWVRQLLSDISGKKTHEHFGIRQIFRETTAGSDRVSVDEDSEGLWFEYTTYRAIAR